VALGCRIAQGVRNFDRRDVRIDRATEVSCRKEAQHEEDDTEKGEIPEDVCELELRQVQKGDEGDRMSHRLSDCPIERKETEGQGLVEVTARCRYDEGGRRRRRRRGIRRRREKAADRYVVCI
jgi:hypothetical protein